MIHLCASITGSRPYSIRCAAFVAPAVVTLRQADSPISIGRAPAMGIVLANDLTASPLHGDFTYASREWLTDDGGLSRNGSNIHGEGVAGRRRFDHGDRLRFGRSEFEFQGVRHRQPCDSIASGRRPPRRAPLIVRCWPSSPGPLRTRPGGLPATDAEIAQALGVTFAEVRDAGADLL